MQYVICLLTKFAFEREKADCVFGCDIADHNPASLKAFQKAGYRVETKVEQPRGGKVRYCFDLVLSRERYAEALEKT